VLFPSVYLNEATSPVQVKTKQTRVTAWRCAMCSMKLHGLHRVPMYCDQTRYNLKVSCFHLSVILTHKMSCLYVMVCFCAKFLIFGCNWFINYRHQAESEIVSSCRHFIYLHFIENLPITEDILFITTQSLSSSTRWLERC
jgi:hypothetical protein